MMLLVIMHFSLTWRIANADDALTTSATVGTSTGLCCSAVQYTDVPLWMWGRLQRIRDAALINMNYIMLKPIKSANIQAL